jgi:hypothetical protein
MTIKELSPLKRSFERINELLPNSHDVLLRCSLYEMCVELTNKSFSEGINTKY